MSTWILSIVGIAFLGVMIDVVSPSGAINKFIKSIFSVLVLFVLVSPIKNLLTKSEIDINQVSNELIEDKNFLFNYNQNLASSYENRIEDRLNQEEINGVDVVILLDLTKDEFEIQEVSVYIQNLVLTDKITHKNKYEKIKEAITSVLNVSKEIVFYEWRFW